jgi:tRNA G10  N-methylase Trm11
MEEKERIPFLVYFAQKFGSAALDEFEDLAEYEGFSRSLDLLGRRRTLYKDKQPSSSCISSLDDVLNEDDNLVSWSEETSRVESNPMYIVHLPPLVAERICKRSVLIKGMWELYGYGEDVHSCVEDVEKRRKFDKSPNEDDDLFENYKTTSEERIRVYSSMKRRRELNSSPLFSWRFMVECYGVSISLSTQEGVRLHFQDCLGAEGPVKLKESECNVTYCAILDFGVAHLRQKELQKTKIDSQMCQSSSSSTTTTNSTNSTIPFLSSICEKAQFYCNNETTSLKRDINPDTSISSASIRLPSRRVYFGKQVGTTSRHLMGDLSLKKRPYLGPTSLDPELALIMANLGRSYAPGALVWDPFVGTGSVSVAVASLGGFPLGTEIDARVLRGKLSRNAVTNFKQYGLSLPEQVRMDATRHAFRYFKKGNNTQLDSGIFDSIVTDPPYGIRAGSNRPGVNEISREEWRASHSQTMVDNNETSQSIDSSSNVVHEKDELNKKLLDQNVIDERNFVDINEELLELAARMLVIGGRLVFLLPAAVDATREQLPFHPLLRRVSSSVEPLSFALSRLVVTMEKIAPYNPYDDTLKNVYRSASRLHTEKLILSGVSLGVGSKAMERVGFLMDEWFDVNHNKKESEELPESMTEHTSSNKKRLAMKRLARQQYRFEKLSSSDVKHEEYIDILPNPSKDISSSVETVGLKTLENGGGSIDGKFTKKERAIIKAREAHASGKVVHIGNVPFDLSQWQEKELNEKLLANSKKQTNTSSHSLVYLFIARSFAKSLGPSFVAVIESGERYICRDAINGTHVEIQVQNKNKLDQVWTMRAISTGNQLSVFIASENIHPQAESRSTKMRMDGIKNVTVSNADANLFVNSIDSRTSSSSSGFRMTPLSSPFFVDYLTNEQISLIETRVDICVRDVRIDKNDGRVFPCLLGIPDDLFVHIMIFAGRDACMRLGATCKTASIQVCNEILVKKIQIQQQQH